MRCLRLTLLLLFLFSPQLQAEERPPNVVVIFCDDLGYGDLGCYGHPSIRTPHLNRMATEGMKFTNFYSAAPVCTPSRASLMTGRLPLRTGMTSNKRRALFPDSAGGLQDSEVTIAEALKQEGYTTGMVGKWHLGHLPQYLPTRHGFDSYYGIPYSNDMDKTADAPKGRAAFDDPKIEYFNVPLMRGEKIIERPADQTTITKRYTEEAVKFIEANQEKPFFLYLAHSMPHVPLFRSKSFADVSQRGLYGDVIEEIDWSVGQVLETLRKLKLDSNTWVVFTSDNGPWQPFGLQGGSAGLLRGGKGSTWEGGMREPGLMWWPGTIPAGTVNHDIVSTLDILPTAIKLAGGTLPKDRVINGVDLSSSMQEKGHSPRTTFFYYRDEELYAIRFNAWKLHLKTQAGYGEPKPKPGPLLYHLGHDPGEQFDVAQQHPEVIAELEKLIAEHQSGMKPGPQQLEKRIRK